MMIAMALACNPALILADEPTTALDVTIQAQILELMKGLSRRLGVAMLMITHNLGVVARYADRVNVMYAGKIVERATAREIYANPRHPYTLGLLRSVPRLDEPRAGEARADSRPAARPASRLPGGCSLRAALRLRRRALPRGGAAPRRDQRRSPLRLLRAGPADLSPPKCWRGPTRARARRCQEAMTDAADHSRCANLVKHFEVGGGLFGGRGRAW